MKKLIGIVAMVAALMSANVVSAREIVNVEILKDSILLQKHCNEEAEKAKGFHEESIYLKEYGVYVNIFTRTIED